jgi:DNA-binding YbaB/EbfC family protein
MNIQKMMKQAAKMQEQLAATLAEKTVEVSVGGGKVSVVANGTGDIISIKIAKEVVDPEDVEFLEDLVLSGVKQAIEKGKGLAQTEMGRLGAGLGLPPGLL